MSDAPVGRGRARSRTLQGDDMDFPDLDGAGSDSSGASASSSSVGSGSGAESPVGSTGSASSPASRPVSSKTQKALADGLRDPSMKLPMHDRFVDETTEEERMEAEIAEMDRLMAQKPAAAATSKSAASAKDGRVTKAARAGDGAAPAYDLIIKLLMLGDSGVGKTSLLQRYARRKFDSKVLASAGVAYETQYVVVEGRTVRVDIWDTAGQERFHVITQAYYAGAHGIILAYDASDATEASFDNIRYWMNAIREHASKDCNKILLGNKVDVPSKAISSERGSAVASEFDVKFFETSAKTGYNVDLAFQSVARDCVVKALVASGVDMSEAGAGSEADADGKGGKRCAVM